MLRILGIGDNMCDFNLTTGIMYPGGQCVNIPVNARLLGQDSAYMGCFGNDFVAEHLKRTLDEIGVDYSHARTYQVPNVRGFYHVIDDDRVFCDPPVPQHPMSSMLFEMLPYEGFTDDDWTYIHSFDLIHCSNDSRLERIYPTFREKGIRMSFDFSIFHDQPGYMEQICPYAWLVLLSCGAYSEEETRELLRKAYGLGSQICIGTRGSRGSICFDGSNFYDQKPHWLDEVTDTMGAGDAFITAFLVDYLQSGGFSTEHQNERIGHALETAAEYAAQSCLVNGSFGHGVAFPRLT